MNTTQHRDLYVKVTPEATASVTMGDDDTGTIRVDHVEHGVGTKPMLFPAIMVFEDQERQQLWNRNDLHTALMRRGYSYFTL